MRNETERRRASRAFLRALLAVVLGVIVGAAVPLTLASRDYGVAALTGGIAGLLFLYASWQYAAGRRRLDRLGGRDNAQHVLVLLAALAVLPGTRDPQPTWPAGIPQPEGALAQHVAEGEAEGHVKVRVRPEGELDAVWKTWLPSFSGLKVLGTGDVEGGHWRTFELASGMRLRVELWREYSGRLVADFERVPKPRDVALPGECVVPEERGFRWWVHSSGVGHDGELHHGSQEHVRRTQRMADLDADGIRDVAVPVVELADGRKAYCPEDVRWRLYVMRGECGHFVGEVRGAWITLDTWKRKPGRRGLRPLELEERRVEHRTRIPDSVTVTRPYRFDGKRYRAGRVTRDSGRCHHCSTWTCAGPELEPRD